MCSLYIVQFWSILVVKAYQETAAGWQGVALQAAGAYQCLSVPRNFGTEGSVQNPKAISGLRGLQVGPDSKCTIKSNGESAA